LTWPTAADRIAAGSDGKLRVGFAELPGSQDVFNVSDQAWENRRASEDARVTTLAVAGRLGAVLRSSPRADASFQLLLWLSDPQWSQQVSPASPSTTLFRQSHLKNARVWVEEAVPVTTAVEYATVAEQALSRQQRLFAIRIPGRTEYLAALDEAVGKAVRAESSPKQALAEAAARWREITQSRGIDQQRRAYSSSLGVE
jgi:ABC-type glycerol-3-phosphate transport system substrate-binding protein